MNVVGGRRVGHSLPADRMPAAAVQYKPVAVAELHDASAIGKRLRDACSDRSGPTFNAMDAVTELLALEACDVNNANRNGKTAIHHTAQLRSDTEVLALLVSSRADVNVATHRGHTPLIYAAGRGRTEVVRFLLAHGADAACTTVNGDSALSMGRSKGIPDDLLDALDANIRASVNPRDFSGDPRAIEAQREHAKHCSCCQKRMLDEFGIPPAHEQAVAEMAGLLVAAAAESTAELSRALLRAAASSEGQPTLRLAIELSLKKGQPAAEVKAGDLEDDEEKEAGSQAGEANAIEGSIACEQLLLATRDETLGRTLGKGAKGRARRPVRMVAGAVYAAIQADGVVESLIDKGADLLELCAAADAHMAAELICRWPSHRRDDAVCVHVWQRLVHDGNDWAPVSCENTPQRAGGPRTAAWARALRWAATVGYKGWEFGADALLATIEQSNALAPLLAMLRPVVSGSATAHPPERRKSSTNLLPPRLEVFLTAKYGSAFGQEEANATKYGSHVEGRRARRHRSAASDSLAESAGDGLAELPSACLSCEPTWIDTAEAIVLLHEHLKERAAAASALGVGCDAASAGAKLVIGVDTEWIDGEELPDMSSLTLEETSKKARARPLVAIVQLAVRERAWVIDALPTACAAELGPLLRWALESELVVTLGFAFQSDLAVLAPLCGAGMAPTSLVDLQPLAMGRGEDTPSLRKVCARTLGLALDKREQCSAWGARPLSADQFSYAALDARILIDVHETLMGGLGDRSSVCLPCDQMCNGARDALVLR